VTTNIDEGAGKGRELNLPRPTDLAVLPVAPTVGNGADVNGSLDIRWTPLRTVTFHVDKRRN
jgi:hypothetical protein